MDITLERISEAAEEEESGKLSRPGASSKDSTTTTAKSQSEELELKPLTEQIKLRTEETKPLSEDRPMSHKRVVSSALASRMSGLDTAKIGFGMPMRGATPPRFKKKENDIESGSESADNINSTSTYNPITNSESISSQASRSPKRISAALQSRMSGLNTSKIGIPGMAAPPRFQINKDIEFKADNVNSIEKVDELSANPNLDRATLNAKRRPSTRRIFKSSEELLISSVENNVSSEKVEFGIEITEKVEVQEKISVVTTSTVSAHVTNRLSSGDDNRSPVCVLEQIPVVTTTTMSTHVTDTVLGDDNDDDRLPSSCPICIIL